MGLLLAVLGGVLAGILLKRTRAKVATRYIFNMAVLALVIVQTVLFFFDTGLPAGFLLTLFLVLWGIDMIFNWESSHYY